MNPIDIKFYDPHFLILMGMSDSIELWWESEAAGRPGSGLTRILEYKSSIYP